METMMIRLGVALALSIPVGVLLRVILSKPCSPAWLVAGLVMALMVTEAIRWSPTFSSWVTGKHDWQVGWGLRPLIYRSGTGRASPVAKGTVLV